MNQTNIHKIYARAFLNILKEEKDSLKRIDELRAVLKSAGDMKKAQKFLECPRAGMDDKLKFLETIFKHCRTGKLVRNFCTLLIRNERFIILEEIIDELETLILEREGKVKAVVTSAVKLEKTEIDSIRDLLEARMGRKIQMQMTENPEIIGGITVQVGNLFYDGSVKGRLENMKQSLSQAV